MWHSGAVPCLERAWSDEAQVDWYEADVLDLDREPRPIGMCNAQQESGVAFSSGPTYVRRSRRSWQPKDGGWRPPCNEANVPRCAPKS